MAPRGLSPTETGSEPAHFAQPHRPHLGEIVRRVAQSLLVACVVPIALFYAFFVTTGVWAAMVAALGWSYGAIAFRHAHRPAHLRSADPHRNGPDRPHA